MLRSPFGVGVISPLAATITAVLVLTGPQGTASAESIDGCGRTGPRIEQGRTGILLGETSLRVDVPDNGTFFSLPGSPAVQGPALFICHVESGSSIVIDARTAKEVTRTVGDASGAAVLDQIAAGAHVEEVALPTPSPSGPALTPPLTGDGGLKRF